MSEHARRIILPLHLLALLIIPFWAPEYLWYSLAGWLLISGYGAAVGLHRYFCHNAFKVSKPMHYVLGWLACLASQGSPIFWNAVHTVHHSDSDKEADFHTPKKGIWAAYWGWIFNLNPCEVQMRLSKRLVKDKYLKWLHKEYYNVVWLSVAVAVVLDFVLTGGFYHVLYGLILPMTYSTHQEPIVNVVCHIKGWGYRNFELDDDSNNIPLLGWLGFGQGYHNNHHARPNTYNYAEKWHEFDPCCVMVRLIKKPGRPDRTIATDHVLDA